MKYALIPFFVVVHALTRYCEWGAKFFGRLNDWFVDYFTQPDMKNIKLK